MGKTYAQVLADYATEVSFENLPAAIVKTAKLSVLDFCGVVLAGYRIASSRIIADYVRALGGAPEATVAGYGYRTSAPQAALANGTMAHSTELDDHEAHERSYVHPGVVVMPTAFAVSETVPVSGKEFIISIVLGYEAMGRLSAATVPGFLDFDRGFHTTALFGPFAAAITAGRLSRLSAAQITNAIGIIGSVCSGLFETRAAGTWTKRLHAGWAAHSGVMAAALGGLGFTGPATILEGRHGLYRAFCGDGNFDLSVITGRLGEAFEFSYIMYKPYACAGVLHSPLTAVDEICNANRFDLNDVEEVTVFTNRRVVEHFTEPRDVKYRPNSGAQAQFSLPYAVATLLVDRAALVDQFTDDAVRREPVLRLASRVRAEIQPEFDARAPKEELCRVTVRLRGGQQIGATVPGGKGTLVYPMTEDELRAKFHRLADPVIGNAAAQEVEECVLALEQQPVVDFVSDLCRKQ